MKLWGLLVFQHLLGYVEAQYFDELILVNSTYMNSTYTSAQQNYQFNIGRNSNCGCVDAQCFFLIRFKNDCAPFNQMLNRLAAKFGKLADKWSKLLYSITQVN